MELFGKRAMSYSEFVNENLFKDNWKNYKDNTDLSSDNPEKDSMDISQIILKMFKITDPSKLIFVSSDMNPDDYLYMKGDVISGLDPIETKATNISGNLAQINLYEYEGHPVCVANIRCSDGEFLSHIFIKDEDYDFFDPVKEEDESQSQSEEGSQEEGGEEGGGQEESQQGGQEETGSNEGSQEDTGGDADIQI